MEIDKNVQPIQLPTRSVPIVLKEPLKKELNRLSNTGVIQRVDTPSDWISAIIVTTKKNGKVRVCIDPKPLNQALHRNHYPLPTIDDVLLLLSRVFTVLDAKNVFGIANWMSRAVLQPLLENRGEDTAGFKCRLDYLQLRKNFREELIWNLKGYQGRRS